ncbi:MAG: ABC transporter permease subunit, partial [Deltaproteobacteria bacterium]|nr:ABC transporter permease subunit [Deltaproteobacteria bacterium]
MHYTGLDKPKGPGYHYFWRTVFAVTVGLAMFFLWYATSSVEYVWQWHRIPQYFWISQERDLNSEFDGEILSTDQAASPPRLILRDDNGAAHEVLLPENAKIIVDPGNAIYYSDVLARYHYSAPGILLEGLWLTLEVSLLAIIVGIGFGIFAGLCRVSENPALRWWAITYVELIRGTPLLVQIFIWYFVVGVLIDELLAQAGLPRIPALWYGVIALAVF